MSNKNINYTNNDGAKFRYSAGGGKTPVKEKAEKVKEALTNRSAFWKTNRAFAIFVLVAAIILFSAFSIYRAVHSREKTVERCYVEASATHDGVRKNVVTMTENAKSLSSLYDAVTQDGELGPEQKELISALESESVSPYWGDTSLAKELHDNSEAIYNRIYFSETDGEIKETAKQYYDALDECYKLLGSETDYTEAAEEYNKVVSKFPVSLLSKDRAPVFERYYENENSGSSFGDLLTDEDGSFSIFAAVKNVVSWFFSLSIFKIILIVAVVVTVIASFANRSSNSGKK